MRNFEFGLSNGQICTLKVTYEEKTMDLGDGNPYQYVACDLIAYVDGNEVDRCWDTAKWILVDANGMKRIQGLRIAFANPDDSARYETWISEMLQTIESEKSAEVREHEAAELAAQKEREQRKNMWHVVKTYKHVLPRGGENGRDGYIDADYVSETGVSIRMVNRDVFDFGCYSYPKRFAGTNDVIYQDKWTDDEKSLAKWLCEFSEFRTVRM